MKKSQSDHAWQIKMFKSINATHQVRKPFNSVYFVLKGQVITGTFHTMVRHEKAQINKSIAAHKVCGYSSINIWTNPINSVYFVLKGLVLPGTNPINSVYFVLKGQVLPGTNPINSDYFVLKGQVLPGTNPINSVHFVLKGRGATWNQSHQFCLFCSKRTGVTWNMSPCTRRLTALLMSIVLISCCSQRV